MKELIDRIYRLRIHLICWGLWIAYEVCTAAYIRGHFSPVLFYLLFYGLNIGLFYLHGSVLLPRALSKGIHWLWKVPLVLALELAGYVLATILLNEWVAKLQRSGEPLVLDLKFFVSMLWRAVLFILFSTGYYFLITSLRRRKLAMDRVLEIEQLNSQLLRAERDYLRSQINPHLLFNTLSFVKFAAKNDRSQAEEAIQRLAALMRFALEKSESGLIDLNEEVTQVRHLIRLNQLRFGGGLFVELVTELEGGAVQILPVMLLTLVENVFKHGHLKDPDYPAQILVSVSGQQLLIQTRNPILAQGNQFHAERFGTGLTNLAARMEVAYPDAHRFAYGIDGQIFEVRLQVDLALPHGEAALSELRS